MQKNAQQPSGCRIQFYITFTLLSVAKLYEQIDVNINVQQ